MFYVGGNLCSCLCVCLCLCLCLSFCVFVFVYLCACVCLFVYPVLCVGGSLCVRMLAGRWYKSVCVCVFVCLCICVCLHSTLCEDAGWDGGVGIRGRR